MRRKALSFLLTAAMVTTLFAGCSKKKAEETVTETPTPTTQAAADDNKETEPTQEPEKQEETSSVDGQGKTLTVLCHSSWRTDEANAVFDYVAAKCNVKFEFEEVPEGDSGNELILARMQSGEVPDILWWQGANACKQNIGIDEFVELSGDWTNDYSESILSAPNQSVDGKLYCAPFGDLTAFGICYNKKVFADNNIQVPNSWDELVADCKILKDAGVIPMFTSATTDNEWTLQIIPIDARLKQELTVTGSLADLNAHKKVWADMDYMKWMFQAVDDLKNNGYMQDTLLSDSYADAQEALLSGKAAMYPQATWIFSELLKLAESDEELNNIGFFPIPSKDGTKTVAYSETPTGFCIPKKGANVDLAMQIVGELSSKEAMSEYYKIHKGVPSVNGVNVELNGIPADVMTYMEAGKTSTLPGAVYSVPSLAKNMQAMLAGDMSPEEVLQAYDTDWDTFAKDKKNPDWGY